MTGSLSTLNDYIHTAIIVICVNVTPLLFVNFLMYMRVMLLGPVRDEATIHVH